MNLGGEKLDLNYIPLPLEYWNQRHEPQCLVIVLVVFRQSFLLNLELAKLFILIG